MESIIVPTSGLTDTGNHIGASLRQGELRTRAGAEALALAGFTSAVALAVFALGPTTAQGNAAALFGVLGSLALVAALHRARSSPWSELGLGRPPSALGTVVQAVAATVVIYAIGLVVLRLALPALGVPTPDASRFAALRANPALLVSVLLTVWITAAFIEEVVFRGFLMERIATAMGGDRRAWIGGLVLSAILFGGLHAYQGLAGVLITGLAGLLFGALYLVVRPNLWVAILAHGLVDTLSLLLICAGLKT